MPKAPVSTGHVCVTVVGPGLKGEREIAVSRQGDEISVVVPRELLLTYAIARIRRK